MDQTMNTSSESTLSADSYFYDSSVFSDDSEFLSEYTPLHEAVKDNDMNRIKKILETSTEDINSTVHGIQFKKFLRCQTPLSLSLTQQNFKIAQLLLSYGANINSSICAGFTALHYFVGGLEKNIDTVKFILKNNANVNVRDSDVYTPLDNCLCAERKDKEIIKLMVLHDAVLNKVTVEELSKKTKKFLSALSKEITAMKSIKLNLKYSLYDFLFMDEINLAKYVDNEVICDIYYSKKLKGLFFHYGQNIKEQFEKGTFEKKLISLSKKALNYFAKKDLPDLCLSEILDKLDREDLKNLSYVSKSFIKVKREGSFRRFNKMLKKKFSFTHKCSKHR